MLSPIGRHLRKRPAVVPGLRPPVFGAHDDSHLKNCSVHHMGYHPKKTYMGNDTSKKHRQKKKENIVEEWRDLRLLCTYEGRDDNEKMNLT